MATATAMGAARVMMDSLALYVEPKDMLGV